MVPGMVVRALAAIALAGMIGMTQTRTKPVRIVSTTLVTDEITAGLVEPSRIIAMGVVTVVLMLASAELLLAPRAGVPGQP